VSALLQRGSGFDLGDALLLIVFVVLPVLGRLLGWLGRLVEGRKPRGERGARPPGPERPATEGPGEDPSGGELWKRLLRGEVPEAPERPRTERERAPAEPEPRRPKATPEPRPTPTRSQGTPAAPVGRRGRLGGSLPSTSPEAASGSAEALVPPRVGPGVELGVEQPSPLPSAAGRPRRAVGEGIGSGASLTRESTPAAIAEESRSASGWARAFVLAEVLGPPIALRDGDSALQAPGLR